MDTVIELYICSLCGVTNETCRHWGPVCSMTGGRVCADCCYRCEHHVSWSGIWRCGYRSPEERKAEARKKAQQRFEEENAKISEAFKARKKEEARQWAIKQARAKARKSKSPGGKY